jgi:hypothetical protein
MLNDFVPAIVAVAFLAAAFLGGWASDLHRMQRPGPPRKVVSVVEMSAANQDDAR